MARKSNLLKLPEEALALLHEWLDDPEITQVEATERLNQMLVELGLDNKLTNKSAVGRYDKNRNERIEQAAENMRARIEEREYWNSQFGDDNLDEAGRQIAQMLYSIVGQISTTIVAIQEMEIEDVAQHAATVKTLTSAARDLENTLSENRKRVEAIKQQAREEAQQEAAEAVESISIKAGLTDEQAGIIRAQILGVEVDGNG